MYLNVYSLSLQINQTSVHKRGLNLLMQMATLIFMGVCVGMYNILPPVYDIECPLLRPGAVKQH